METSSHSAVTAALCPDRQSPRARLHKPEDWLLLQGSRLDPMLVAFSPAQPSTTPHGKDCPGLVVSIPCVWGALISEGWAWASCPMGAAKGAAKGCHGGITEGPSLHNEVARAGRGGRALGRKQGRATSCSGLG